MSIPYRKIKLLFKEAFNLDFEPSSAVGFDKQIRVRGTPLYEDMKKGLKDKPVLNVDETGWYGDWLWCYASAESVVYVIKEGRGQKEVEEVLGKKYSGVLISDLLSAYNKIESKKQKCLIHIVRLIKKWHKYYEYDKKMVKYFSRLKKLIKQIIELSESMEKELPKNFTIRKADLIGQLRRMLNKKQGPIKAEKFRKRLLKQIDELVTCLDFVEVSSHNNFVERLLRLSVIMRKITFGNRSEEGSKNHEVIMSLLQTARLKEINPLSFLYALLTNKTEAAQAIS